MGLRGLSPRAEDTESQISRSGGRCDMFSFLAGKLHDQISLICCVSSLHEAPALMGNKWIPSVHHFRVKERICMPRYLLWFPPALQCLLGCSLPVSLSSIHRVRPLSPSLPTVTDLRKTRALSCSGRVPSSWLWSSISHSRQVNGVLEGIYLHTLGRTASLCLGSR